MRHYVLPIAAHVLTLLFVFGSMIAATNTLIFLMQK